MGVAVHGQEPDAPHAESSTELNVSRAEIRWFSLGQAGMAVKWQALDFLVFFYTQVIGLSGTLTGIAGALVSVSDAITDPMAGGLSDRHRSPHGRRHPFLFISTPFIAITFYLLWSPPSGWSAPALFLWLLGSKSLLELAMTFYAVPYYALGAELSPHYEERTRIVMARQISERFSKIVVGALILLVFFRATPEYENGQLNPSAYPHFAALFACAMPFLLLAAPWRTRHLVARLPRPTADQMEGHAIRGIVKDFRETLRYRSFRVMFITSVTASVGWGASGMLVLHMITYFWLIDTNVLFFWGAAMYGGALAGMPFWTKRAQILDKKVTYVCGVVLYIVFMVGPVVLRLMGLWVPRDHLLYLPLYIATTGFLAHFGLAATSVTGASMLADVADLDELHHGKRREGIFFGVESFAGKAVSGLGSLVAGVIIDIVGIAGNTNPSPESVHSLGVAYSSALIALLGLSGIVACFYDIDRAKHDEIRAELTRRKLAPIESPFDSEA